MSGALPLLFGGTRASHQAGDIQVIGVVAPRGGGAGVAVLSIGGRPAVSVREGGQIAPGVRLLEVLPQGVVLERNGQREEARLPQRPTVGAGADTVAGAAGRVAPPTQPSVFSGGSQANGVPDPSPSTSGNPPTVLSPTAMPAIVHDPD